MGGAKSCFEANGICGSRRGERLRYAAARGQGVGRALLQALILESERNGIWTLQASIFPENQASLKLHESLGFRTVGHRERVSTLNGVWRNTVILERRSKLVGVD